MKKLVFLVTVITLGITSCKQQTKTPKNKIEPTTVVKDSLTTKIDSLFTSSAIVGLSAVILKNDTVLYTHSVGYADVANNKPYTQQTIQNIGSISKTFIGLALLKAQELGKLKLDDPANKYLPFKVANSKFLKTPITIRQLATHTSSINDTDWYGKSYVMLEKEHPKSTTVLDYFSSPESDMPMADYLKKVLTPKGEWYEPEIFGDYAPGKKSEYSNIASTLAALVIEGATGKPFTDFTKEHILKPLEMTASGWNNTAIDISKRSKNYMHKDTLIADYKLITYPDGGMITSTDNLSSYLIELMKGYQGNGTLLTKENYQELFKKQLNASQLGEEAESNTGIFIDFSKYGIGHNGGDPGVLTFMYFNPETSIGKILFINTDYDTNQEVLKSFFRIWKTLEAYEHKLN